MSLLHVNAHSAPKNLDNYIFFLQNINIDFSVVGVSETWLNDSNVDTCNISGYNHVCNYRKGEQGGGVSLFLRQGIDDQTCDYLTLMNDFESVFVQLSHESIKPTRDIIVGVIDRESNTDVKVVYTMGDYDIDLLNVHTHIPTADFIDMMYPYSFFLLITKPTRVTGNTATLTDNIFCNDVDCLDMMNGIFYNYISDHFPIFSINFKGHTADTKQYITKRMLTTKTISSCQDRLANADLNNTMSSSECQQGYSMFHKKYMIMYNDCFPLKHSQLNRNNETENHG